MRSRHRRRRPLRTGRVVVLASFSDPGRKIDTPPAECRTALYLLVRQQVDASPRRRRAARRWRNEVRGFRDVTRAGRGCHPDRQHGWGKLHASGRQTVRLRCCPSQPQLAPAAGRRLSPEVMPCLKHATRGLGPTDEARVQSLVDVIDLIGRNTELRVPAELAACLQTVVQLRRAWRGRSA